MMMVLLQTLVLSLAQDPADALRGALSSVRALRYEATLQRSLVVEEETWRASGGVVLARAAGTAPFRARVEARVSCTDPAAPRDVVLVRNGEHWLFVDHGTRSFVLGDSAHLGGEWSETAWRLVLRDLLIDAPFAEAGGLAETRAETYAGEACRRFDGESGDARKKLALWIGAADLLPRLVERTTKLPGAETLVERLTLAKLAQNPSYFVDPFDLTPPEGYARREPEIASTSEPSAPESTPAALVQVASDVTPVRDAFEAQRGKPRVIGLFAPT